MNQYRRYRKSSTMPLTSKALLMRKRIARNRMRAQLVGTVYLLSIIALAVVACLPLFVHKLAPVGVMEFYKVFLWENLKEFRVTDTDRLITLLNAVLYAVLLLALFINVLKALSKLGWLSKKTGNKTYGFNRNVYAMEDVGRIFSSSFETLVSVYMLIAVLSGQFAVNVLMLIVFGGCVALRLLLGFLGAKIAYYDYERGEIIEERRRAGRIVPLIRNFLQLSAISGVLYFFNYKSLHDGLVSLTSQAGRSALFGSVNAWLIFAVQIVVVLCMFVLIKHATGMTEYNFDGARGLGMKNFKIFSFLVLLAAGGGFAYEYFAVGGKRNESLLIIAGIAFAIFLVEMILFRYPNVLIDQQKRGKEKQEDDEEFSFETFTRYQRAQTKWSAQQTTQPQQSQLPINIFK